MATYSLMPVAAYGKGTSTGTGTQQTIAHGCGGKPDLISITPDVTDGSCSVIGVGKDATNIYCTVTSGKDYGWVAIRLP